MFLNGSHTKRHTRPANLIGICGYKGAKRETVRFYTGTVNGVRACPFQCIKGTYRECTDTFITLYVPTVRTLNGTLNRFFTCVRPRAP